MWKWLKSLFSSGKKKNTETHSPSLPGQTQSPEVEVKVVKDQVLAVPGGNPANPTIHDWTYIWEHAEVDSDKETKDLLAWILKRVTANATQYQLVEKETKTPWWFVAVLHYREASFRMDACLHNGDPWDKVTVHVPRGRGPWKSWVEAAIDAIRYDKLDNLEWSFPLALQRAEKYNGTGYRRQVGDRGVVEYSPYVVACTNWHDETGKFYADHKYSKTYKANRPGCLAIWKEMQKMGMI